MHHGQLLTPWRLLDLAPVDILLWPLARLRARQNIAACLIHRVLASECGARCHNIGTTDGLAPPALVNNAVSKTFVRDETSGCRLTVLDRGHIATSFAPKHRSADKAGRHEHQAYQDEESSASSFHPENVRRIEEYGARGAAEPSRPRAPRLLRLSTATLPPARRSRDGQEDRRERSLTLRSDLPDPSV